MKKMKKIALLALVTALVITGCGKKENKEDGKNGTTAQAEQSNGAVDLSKETAEYKKFVEEQIDMLLKDTENLTLTRAGKVSIELKKYYGSKILQKVLKNMLTSL